jgi:hypothetical protein
MTARPDADDRLAGMITRLDIALVLHSAGIDTRSFTPDELDRLSRTLLVASRRGGSSLVGDPVFKTGRAV